MIGILAKKVGMTQIFDAEGERVPVTVLEAGPCRVTEIRTKDKHGYTAVQLGFDAAKEKQMSRPERGQMTSRNLPLLKFVREIRTPKIENLAIGDEIQADIFQEGDYVDVEGVSIGKGFQGVVKRHHFKGGEKSHGSKMGREPGAVGSKAGGNGCRKKVRKGKKLPGHLGHARVTVQSLRIVKLDSKHNLLALRGAVPGVEGSYLVIRSALKRASSKQWKVSSEKSSQDPQGVDSEKK